MGHGREGNTHPQGLSFPLSDRIHRAFSHIAHKRRNVRFNRLRRVHTPPRLLTVHTAAYAAKHGAFWMGVVSLPSERFARFGNPARPGIRTANFAAFGSWSGVLPKNVESLRNSDALMRVAVPRRRGPAGLRDPMAASLHRGTPRFCSTVITECGEKHTSFLCTELLCQLCLRLPPLCCTL